MLLSYPMSQQFNFACSNPFFFFAPAHTSWFCFALCLVHLAMFSLDGSHRHSRSQLPPPRGELKPATLLHGAAEGSREQEGSQRLPRAPGLPERGGTDPREEKGHTYLRKFLRFSGTLSLTLLGNVVVRSSLRSLTQEETAYLDLVFSNYFHWIYITTPLPQPSRSFLRWLNRESMVQGPGLGIAWQSPPFDLFSKEKRARLWHQAPRSISTTLGSLNLLEVQFPHLHNENHNIFFMCLLGQLHLIIHVACLCKQVLST